MAVEKWEYHTDGCAEDDKNYYLSKRAAEGWELVSVTFDGSGTRSGYPGRFDLFFKRRLEDKQTKV